MTSAHVHLLHQWMLDSPLTVIVGWCWIDKNVISLFSKQFWKSLVSWRALFKLGWKLLKSIFTGDSMIRFLRNHVEGDSRNVTFEDCTNFDHLHWNLQLTQNEIFTSGFDRPLPEKCKQTISTCHHASFHGIFPLYYHIIMQQYRCELYWSTHSAIGEYRILCKCHIHTTGYWQSTDIFRAPKKCIKGHLDYIFNIIILN